VYDGHNAKSIARQVRMTADELIALNDQIAGMAKAGLPMDQGLASLAREMGHGRLRRVTAAIAADLHAGVPLTEAVDQRRGDMPPFYSHLVAAGIRTGKLPEVLATLTAYARTVTATRSIVVESLFYPTVVMLLGAALMVLLVLTVLPQFDQVFQGFQMQLPPVTQAVLWLGRNPFITLAVPATIVAFLLLAWLLMRMTDRGRQGLAQITYAVPVVGTLVRSARLAAFADLMAVLVEYELPLPEAFRLAGVASSDPLMAARTDLIYTRLSSGTPLALALRGLGLLPEWVAWMAGTGERRGALAPALRQIAAIYRRQVEARSAILRSVLPACMIIATAGVLVATFAAACMMPMIKLLEGLSM
jgi:type II secretory pathway component PulF